MEITGTEGTVILENDLLTITDLRNAQHDVSNQAPNHNASAASPVVDDIRGHQRVIEDFIEAMRSNGMPACDGREGRRSVALVERIYAASEKARG